MSELSDLFAAKDPDEWRKKLAAALATEATSGAPIQSWTQGANRMAQAALAAYMMNQGYSERQDDLRKQAAAERIAAGIDPLPDEPPSSGFFGRGPKPISPPSVKPISSTNTPPTDNSAPYSTVPSGVLGGSFNGVPLPPPRPVYDRTALNEEIQNNPDLAARALTMAKGEVGSDPRKQQIELESWANRAKSRGTTGAAQLQTYTGQGSPGYYPPQTFAAGQGSPEALNAMLRGSDLGGQTLGFSPTGNASGTVADNGMRSRNGVPPYYTNAGRIGAETFVTHRPDNLVRLEASRVPQNFSSPPMTWTPPTPEQAQDVAQASQPKPWVTPTPQQVQDIAQANPNLIPRDASQSQQGEGLPQGAQYVSLPPSGQMPSATPQPSAQSAPVQMAQAGTSGVMQGVQTGPTREEIIRRIDILTKRGDRASLQQAQLLGQKLRTPDTTQMHTTADGRVMIFNPRTSQWQEITQGLKPTGGMQEVQYAREHWKEMNMPDPNSSDPADQAKWGDYMTKRLGGTSTSVSVNTVANPVLEGVGKQVVDQRKLAYNAVESIPLIHDARNALDNGAFTGAFSPAKVAIQKLGTLFGVPADQAANSETFLAAVGRQVIAHAKSLGPNPSNADRDYIAAVEGGRIQLEESTLRRLLDIDERVARYHIKAFNRDADKLMKADPKAYSGIAPLMNVEEPPEYRPPETYPRPQGAEQGPYGQPAPPAQPTREEAIQELRRREQERLRRQQQPQDQL